MNPFHVSFCRSSTAGCLGSYTLGLFFIVVQCFTWVVAGVLTQYIYDDKGFQSPFLMSYIGISMLVFLLPLKLLTDRLHLTNGVPGSVISAETFDSLHKNLDESAMWLDYVDIASRRTEELIENAPKQWNHCKHMLAAIYIAPAMFCADWACNAAMVHTTLASVTVIISTQSVLVFVMSVVIGLEPYCHFKLLGVLVAVVGTAMTTLGDAETDAETHNGSERAFYGDLMAFIASLCFATYSIQVRLFCPPNEELYSTQLLLGYIGVVCSIPLLPFALWSGSMQDTLTAVVLALVVVKGVLDFVVIEYLLFRIYSHERHHCHGRYRTDHSNGFLC